MLQLLISLIPVFFTGLLSYLIYRVSTSMHICSEGMLMDLRCLFTRTAALDAFFMFIMDMAIAAFSIALSLGNVSNHFIINLDIIFIISSLLLVLYHNMKESGHPLIKAI